MADTALVERITPPTDIVAQATEATVPAERDTYVGIAERRVSKEQEAILLRPCEIDELDILPTGEVYMSQVEYRRRLNASFGPCGWALRPLGKPTVMGNTLMQEWALYAEGRFVGSAWGEHDYNPRNPRDSWATASEALKSNALMRCCKDIGIAAECWNRRFMTKFQKEHCIKVWRSKAKNGAGEYQWRRKDADAFYDEGKGRGRQAPDEAPEDVDRETGEVRPSAQASEAPAAGSEKVDYISGKQQKELIAAGTEAGWDGKAFAAWLKKSGYKEWSKIPVSAFSSVMAIMKGGTDASEDSHVA